MEEIVLGLDYKTVRHHLKILLDNKIIIATGGEIWYGVFIISQYGRRR
jgi:DNA-binding transcriptional ArsR family regulator